MAADTAGSRRFEARPAGEGRVREGLWASQGKNEDQREYSPKRGWLTRRPPGSGEEESRSSSARDATRRAEARGPGTRVRGRRAGRGPGARGAGRGPGAQRKPNAESPREVTRKRREGAARGARRDGDGGRRRGRRGRGAGNQAGLADGTTRPSAASGPHRPAGRNTVRACVRGPHVCTRVHARPRGGAGQGRARGTTARECTRARKSRPRTENSARTAPQNNADALRTFPHATLYRSRSISHRDTLTPNAATRSSRRRGPGAVTLCGLAGSHQFSKQDRHPLVLQFRSQCHKD